MLSAVFGFIIYVGVYSLYMKRKSVYGGTPIGSLSGSAPPVIGYCAVSGEFDAGAAFYYLSLVCGKCLTLTLTADFPF